MTFAQQYDLERLVSLYTGLVPVCATRVIPRGRYPRRLDPRM